MWALFWVDKERQHETRILSSGANFNIEVGMLKLLGEGSLRRVTVNELVSKLRFVHIFFLIVASYSSYSSAKIHKMLRRWASTEWRLVFTGTSDWIRDGRVLHKGRIGDRQFFAGKDTWYQIVLFSCAMDPSDESSNRSTDKLLFQESQDVQESATSSHSVCSGPVQARETLPTMIGSIVLVCFFCIFHSFCRSYQTDCEAIVIFSEIYVKFKFRHCSDNVQCILRLCVKMSKTNATLLRNGLNYLSRLHIQTRIANVAEERKIVTKITSTTVHVIDFVYRFTIIFWEARTCHFTWKAERISWPWS